MSQNGREVSFRVLAGKGVIVAVIVHVHDQLHVKSVTRTRFLSYVWQIPVLRVVIRSALSSRADPMTE